jgi:putative FmdB family regulatory protein
MPIYAYRCESCGFGKDVLQKLSDAPLTHCPECGADAFRKQVTAAGFQLKGSGWYVTDFRGGNSKPSNASNEAGKSGEGGAGSGGKSDGGKSEGGSTNASSSEGGKSDTPSASSTPAATPAASGGASSS